MLEATLGVSKRRNRRQYDHTSLYEYITFSKINESDTALPHNAKVNQMWRFALERTQYYLNMWIRLKTQS